MGARLAPDPPALPPPPPPLGGRSRGSGASDDGPLCSSDGEVADT
jgi:hypothetical protein